MTPTTPQPADAGTQFVTSKDGTKLAYEKVGQGPPLVYVMGAMGTRGISFSKPMRDELSKSFTLYWYDRRGRGESEAGGPGYVVEREIEDLRAMCELAGGHPIVCGTSSGAALALTAAAAGVPMRLLVAHEPPYAVGADAASFDRSYPTNVTRMVAEGRNDEAVKYFMRTVGVPGAMIWMMRFMPIWKQLVAAAPSLPYDAAVLGDFTLPEPTLRTIRVPTLVLAGGSTPPRLRTAADAVANTVPGARIRILPKQNHAVKPSALRAAVEEAAKTAG